MARFPFKRPAVTQDGKILPGANVVVYLSGTSTLATVYESESGSALTNSATTSDSSTGMVEFWVDNTDYSNRQRFRVTISKFGVTWTYDDVEIISDLYTTIGDIVQAGTGGVPERLAIGTTSQLAQNDGTGKLAYTGAPTISDLTNANHDHSDAASGGTLPAASTPVHDHSDASNGGNTLTIPTIGSFANATHDHADAAGGGNTLTIPTIADFTNANHTHSSVAQGGALPNSAFSVHKNGTNQTSVGSATETLVTWSTEAVDQNGDFASNKWTPTVSKPVILCAKLRLLALENASYVEVRIIKNGATTLASQRGISANTTMTVDSGTAVAVDVPNGTTDYYEAYVYHDGTGTKSIDGTRSASYFCGAMIF